MTLTSTNREARPTVSKGLLFLIVIALVGAGLVFAALTLRSAEGPKVPSADQVPEPISVAVVPAEFSGSFDLEETFTGLIAARRTSQIGFTEGGRIDRLMVDVGDNVDEGTVLGQLDTRALRARLTAAEATVTEMVAALDLSLTTLERQRQLRDDGHVSQQVVDEFAAQASRTAAQLDAAKAQADTLRVQIDLARLRAPYGGVVTQRFADEGVIASPGMPVYELVEASALEARVGVPDLVAATLEVGANYDLRVAGGVVPATLRAKTGVIDARARTVSVVFDLETAETAYPGAVARLPIFREVEERGMWVPVTSLTEGTRGLWSIMVAEPKDDGHLAELRTVEIVHNDGARVFVRGSLNDGDMIIADGLLRLSPGQPVTPRQTPLETAEQEDSAAPY